MGQLEEESIETLPKEFMCEAYSPGSKLAEFYLRLGARHLDKVIRILAENKILEIAAFLKFDREKGEFIKGFLADLSESGRDAASIARILENTEGVLEVRFSDKTFNGLIIDELFFPLLVEGERSFTLKVESFGEIAQGLYEKFGTGAAVILYEMGRILGDRKFKSATRKYHLNKQTTINIILAERSAKGWCIAKLEEFSSKGATVTVKELFECLFFKGQDKPFSQFFRGYITGVFQQAYGKDVSVTETECIAKGDPVCRFKIQVVK
ncbi:MAG: V4R domain-containing protein [Thermoproteota archaeon]